MNKAELISAAAEQAGLSKKDTEAVVNATLDTIANTLAEGEEVRLVGFGTFEVKKREARTGRNPKTKEEIKIPATKVPAFKAGKALKDAPSFYSGCRCKKSLSDHSFPQYRLAGQTVPPNRTYL